MTLTDSQVAARLARPDYVPINDCPLCKKWGAKFGLCGYHVRNATQGEFEAWQKEQENFARLRECGEVGS